MGIKIATTPQIRLALMPDADKLNRRILKHFGALQERQDTQRSHFFHGRFENIYIDRQHLPEILPLITAVEDIAKTILDSPASLRCGYWFNWMRPGQRTSIHAHEENDELLSAVYYVTVPDHSGDLIFGTPPFAVRLRPAPGVLAFFSPQLPHAVDINASDQDRLSIAFNLGPA